MLRRLLFLTLCGLGLCAFASAQDLPHLDTGDAQLAWIDRRYPETNDDSGRRWALERSLQYFASDPVTVFRCQVRLALLDWNEGRLREAHESLRRLVSHPRREIGRDLIAWAEISDAKVLADAKQTEAAAETLDEVSRDGRLTIARRSDAASALAGVLLPTAPVDSIQVLEDMAAIPGGDTPAVEAGIIHALLFQKKLPEVRRRAEKIGDAKNGEAELAAILDLAAQWNQPGDGDRAVQLADAVGESRAYASADLNEGLAALRGQAASRQIQSRLLTELSTPPLAAWCQTAPNDRELPVGAFDRAIAKSEEQGQAAQCLGLELRVLATHPALGDFASRLWRAAGFADWVERIQSKAIDPAVASSLLDACDQLPAGSTYQIEGRMLRAQRLGRAGDRTGEQSVLRDILAFQNLPASYLEPVCRSLGASLESAGDLAGAVRVYRLAEPAAAQYGSGADCLLRAVLDDLALGQPAEADRLAHRLADAPASATDASSSPEEIREFAALVNTGQAGSCWSAGAAGWSDWVRLAGDLGIDPKTAAVPTVANADALDHEAREAQRHGDAHTFFRDYFAAASLARWLPSYGLEVAALQSAAAQFAPARRSELRRLTIQVLACPHPDSLPGAQERRLYLATNDYSAQDPVAALQVAKSFFAGHPPIDGISQAMHRVQALAALKAGQDYAESAAGLQGDLASNVADSQRDLSVKLLGDLNERLRQTEAPVEAADPIGSWIRSAQLTWYDYAVPANLNDPSLSSLDSMLADPNSNLPPAEVLKLRLLAAQDTTRSEETRRKYFRQAVRQLLQTVPGYARFLDLTRSVVDNEAFDRETRSEILWTALATCAEEGRPEDYRRLRQHPLAAHLAPEFQKKLAVLDIEAAADRSSAASLLRAADQLGAHEIGSYGALTLRDFLGGLLKLGDVTDADALAGKLTSWHFEAGASSDSNTLQVEFDRRIRLARAIDGVQSAIAAALLDHFGSGPSVLPAVFADLRLSAGLPARGSADTFAAALYLAAHRQFDRDDFGFWGTAIAAMPPTSVTVAALRDMLHAGLAAAPDDSTRSQIMVVFFSSADTDSRAVRRVLEKEFAAYRDPAKSPACYLIDRLYEIHRDLRLGAPIALQTAFADLTDPRAQIVRERTCLRAYAESGDRENLRRTVDEMDSGRLLSPGFIGRAMDAFSLLGRKNELQNAREVARRQLRQAVLESWLTHDPAIGNTALDLAESLGDPDVLPAKWVAELSQGSGDPVFQGRILLVEASLRGDWPKAEAAAAALNQRFPTLYTYFWYRGLALHRLGRDSEAIESLSVFTRYAKDEVKYPEAVRLLANLRSATSDPSKTSSRDSLKAVKLGDGL